MNTMDRIMKRLNRILRLSGLLLAGMLLAGCGQPQQASSEPASSSDTPQQQQFDSPEAAIAAMAELIGKQDRAGVERVFGAGAYDLFDSGDPDADKEDFQQVKAMIDESVTFDAHDEGTRIALLGADEWPWPIPLVAIDGQWRFDTAAGRDELLNRRVGRNELETLDTLHEIVDAQHEYASEARDDQPPAFARQFVSTEGRRDGLFWPPVAGEPLSPLGDLLADSEYRAGEQRPFQGYYYRILTAQGPAAPGGARSYLDASGALTGGFAVVAWPAEHGSSGVMTFLVNQQGIVFQKDLGPETASLAAGMEAYDPDATWLPTADHLEASAPR
jgi:hypothetical protein